MELIILFITGVFATTIGTLVGGGGFISLPIMILLGIPIHSAIGANKVSNTFSSFSSFFVLYKKKQIALKASLWIIPVSLAGGISGGFIASILPSRHMFIVAIILLIFAFLSSFIGKGNFAGEKELTPNKVSLPGLYSIGIYDGIFGPGQGTLMMYLYNYLNVKYIKAVAYTRLATFSSCFGAACMYIFADKIIWFYTIMLLLGSCTGAQIGVRIAEKLKPEIVKPLLRIVTIALIIQIFVENVL